MTKIMCNSDAVFYSGQWDVNGGPDMCRRNAQLIIDTLKYRHMGLFDRIRSSNILIDMGCATGEGTRVWHREVGKIVKGAEVQPTAIYLSRHRHPHISFVETRCIPTVKRTRSTVVASNMLESMDTESILDAVENHLSLSSIYIILTSLSSCPSFPEEIGPHRKVVQEVIPARVGWIEEQWLVVYERKI